VSPGVWRVWSGVWCVWVRRGAFGRGAEVNLGDDLGALVPLRSPPRRVVSLVPSITETVAVSAPERLAGVTDYCTHPPGIGVPRVGGSKYPNLRAVLDLAPDL